MPCCKTFKDGNLRFYEDQNPIDGSFKQISVIPIKNLQGEVEFVLENVRDVTAEKVAVDEKINAQHFAAEQEKHALIGQIAGKMAHDFNNVLGAIMGNAELALLDLKDSENRKPIDIIYKQAIRGKNLTRNLVAFAKHTEIKQEYFKLNDKITLVLDLLKRELEGIRIIRDDQMNVPDLLADPGMIEHTLVNLLQNSIHATSLSDDPVIAISTFSDGEIIFIKIEDNGCGIPKKQIGNIYEPSFTLKGAKDLTHSYKSDIKGTGYGMANVKRYIEQHNGSIIVKSEFGAGTEFTIGLPVIRKELSKKEREEIRSEQNIAGKYILLVEDEQSISEVQYRILTQSPCNHKVDIASNGQIAMDLLNRNTYDLLSLDYMLPGKINGMDVYKHARAISKSVPILFISGNLEFLESIRELKKKDLFVDHLSKPCQNRSYITCVNSLLNKF